MQAEPFDALLMRKTMIMRLFTVGLAAAGGAYYFLGHRGSPPRRPDGCCECHECMARAAGRTGSALVLAHSDEDEDERDDQREVAIREREYHDRTVARRSPKYSSHYGSGLLDDADHLVPLLQSAAVALLRYVAEHIAKLILARLDPSASGSIIPQTGSIIPQTGGASIQEVPNRGGAMGSAESRSPPSRGRGPWAWMAGAAASASQDGAAPCGRPLPPWRRHQH